MNIASLVAINITLMSVNKFKIGSFNKKGVALLTLLRLYLYKERTRGGREQGWPFPISFSFYVGQISFFWPLKLVNCDLQEPQKDGSGIVVELRSPLRGLFDVLGIYRGFLKGPWPYRVNVVRRKQGNLGKRN